MHLQNRGGKELDCHKILKANTEIVLQGRPFRWFFVVLVDIELNHEFCMKEQLLLWAWLRCVAWMRVALTMTMFWPVWVRRYL
jgi:hypothetical protein